jgi:hypothetical protein
LHYCGADDRQAGVLDRAPRDWTIVPRAWFDLAVPGKLALAVSAVAGMGCAGAVLSARKYGTAAELACTLGLAWMTVFGPATENPTYSLLAGPCAWAIVASRRPWLAMAAFVLLLACRCARCSRSRHCY